MSEPTDRTPEVATQDDVRGDDGPMDGTSGDRVTCRIAEDRHLPWRSIAARALGMGLALFPVMTIAKAVLPPRQAWQEAMQFGLFYACMLPVGFMVVIAVRSGLTWSCPAYEVRDGVLRAEGSTGTDVSVRVSAVRDLTWPATRGAPFGMESEVPGLLVTVIEAEGPRTVEFPPLKLWGARRRDEALTQLRRACGLPTDAAPHTPWEHPT